MPIRNGKLSCVNHTDTEMSRNEGFSAIAQATKSGAGIHFDQSRGVPLVVFFCQTCGYVELYVAMKTDLWK